MCVNGAPKWLEMSCNVLQPHENFVPSDGRAIEKPEKTEKDIYGIGWGSDKRVYSTILKNKIQEFLALSLTRIKYSSRKKRDNPFPNDLTVEYKAQSTFVYVTALSHSPMRWTFYVSLKF